jgi:hypothetical protein
VAAEGPLEIAPSPNATAPAADSECVTKTSIVGNLILGGLLAYHLFRLVCPRKRGFEVSAMSESWMHRQRGTSGDTY